MASEPVRRSKRGMAHEEHAEEELSIKIPRLEELGEEEDKRSRASVSPAVGMATTASRRDSRVGQGPEKPAELFRKDLISAMKLADTEQLQPDDYVLISDSWKQEWEHGVQVPVNPNETIQRSINLKKIAGNENLHGSYAFKLPYKKFLHATQDDNYKQGIHELHETQKLADQVCRYDLDDLDVAWLNKMNDEREAMGQEPVAEWTMEKVVEEMENQCYNNMQNMIKTVEGLGIEYDENVVCDVCRSPEGEDNNEIVFCDGCDICVHQACYGIQKIPEGSWLCRTCALGIKPQCILCPKTGGAMKSTKSGTKWSHVSCALWIPEVSIGCPEKMEPITKISQIPSSRWSLICNICRERNGACIQCSVKTCKTAFHVTCAFNNNLHMKTILDEDHDDVQLKAYCGKHSNLKKKDTDQPPSTPKKDPSTAKRDLILLRDPETPSKRESEMTEEEKTKLRSHRLAKLAEEFYACVEVHEVAEACKMDEETIDFFYNYWVLKRKSNFNKPLLTPKTEEADLLLKQREDSLIARMKMFIHLRQDLERVRNLCYMVSRREKIRRQLYSMKEDIFQQQVVLLDAMGSQCNTRDYHNVIRAHRQSDSLYDHYDAVLLAAKVEDLRQKQEDAARSDTENDSDSSTATSSTKVSVKRTRDSKRRLAFAKAAKAKKNKTEEKPEVKSVGEVPRVPEIGGGDAGQDPVTPASDAEKNITPGRRGRKPASSFLEKKRSRRSLMRMAASIKPSDNGESTGVLDTSVSEAEISMSEEPGAESTKVPQTSPNVRSRRSLRSRGNLDAPLVDTVNNSDRVTKESSQVAAKQAKEEEVVEKMDSKGQDTIPQTVTEKKDVSESAIPEPVPSDSPKGDSKASSPSEQSRPSRYSKRTRKVSESNSKSASDKGSVCEQDTEETLTKVVDAETERTNCDTEEMEEVDHRTTDDESVDSTYSPKVTRRRSALERSSNALSPKLGGNGTALPQVEVSVDEASGKISLRVRNHTVVDKKSDRSDEIITENGEAEKVVTHRQSNDLDTAPSSPGKNRLRVQRRSSSRLQSLGINGLVSPSQLIVRQEIKDKVHNHLGRNRPTRQQLNNHHQVNGIGQGEKDHLLSSRRRRSSPSKMEVDVTSDIMEGSLTKENLPNNGPLLSKYPITIDLTGKGLDKNLTKSSLKSPKADVSPPGSRKSSVFGDLDLDRSDSVQRRRIKRSPDPDNEDSMTTPAMSTRSSRATTPEGFTNFMGRRSSLTRNRETTPSVINISDSEDSLNLLVPSDSEYAPSEDSENSGPVRRSRRRSSKVLPIDEASRDSTTSSMRSSARLSRNSLKIAS